MADNETIADIIAEMRFHGQQNIDAEKDKPEYGILTVEGGITLNCADRLEAAHKHEVDALKQRCAELVAEVAAKDEVIKRLNDAIAEEQRRQMATTEKSLVVGDCAKLREFARLVSHMNDDGDWNCSASICVLVGKAEAALAAPPRNCDVGTAEEQAHRFHAFCMAHQSPIKGMCDPPCPCHEQPDKCHCMTAWAQMPYEEGGNDGK